MKFIKQNTVVLCSLLFFLLIVVDTAAADDYADGKLGKALILGQDTNASLFAPRPESAEEMEWHRQNLEEEIDLRKKAQAAIDAKIPLAEKDPYRPVFHFRPPAQWMNDICGAIFYKGYYHIFYQYNPHSSDHWGANYTAWAHARSKDMVTWEDLPWSFMPMKNRGERRCNSGCVTVDENGRPMIFYTFVPQNNTSTKLGKREQWAAIPLDDDLIKWRRVKGPVMAAGEGGVPESVPGGWSDPFVFRAGGRTFVTYKSCNGLVGEATNEELTKWKYVGQMDGVTGECPNFFPLDDKWVLLRSSRNNQKAIHFMSYVVGDFDHEKISFNNTTKPKTFDSGFGNNPPKDRSWTRGLYGTNAFLDDKGRRMMVGWVNGFRSKLGWNGCMSLPRVLTLGKDNILIQTPAPELKKLRGKHHSATNMVLNNESKRIKEVNGDTLEIMVEFDAVNAKAFGLNVRQSADGKNAVTIKYENDILNVAGTEVKLPSVAKDKKLTLQVFIDKSVLEVFINGGRATVTRAEYPGLQDMAVSVFAEGGKATVKSFDAWELKSIYK